MRQKCPSCNNILQLSKIENEKWICKECNLVFIKKQIIHQTTLNDFEEKNVNNNNEC